MLYSTHERHPITFSLLIAHCLLLIVLFSCSVQKQIARSAKENVLAAAVLQTAHVGISIYEPATNKYWYNYQSEHYFIPASNTKIPTCYAAMKYLGDSLTGLKYNIINDTLVEVSGAADPTFLNSDFENHPAFNFLKKFKLILLVDTVFVDFLGSGWSWNDYQKSYMAQRSNFPIYGNVARFKWLDNAHVLVTPDYFLKSIMEDPQENLEGGFEIYKPWDVNLFYLKHGKQKSIDIPFNPDIPTITGLLADTLQTRIGYPVKYPLKKFDIIHSQPTDSLLKPMMHRSDNFFAEQSLLMVSNERLGIMNDAKIIDTLLKTDFKDLPQKPRWVDGSGLSRYNLFSPQDLVAILNKMKNEFGLERIKVILPTGGEGTISNYYKADSGYIYAKTGSLSGVIAFSGFLYTKKNKLLIFSALVNNHNGSATDVRRAVEKFLQGIRNKY